MFLAFVDIWGDIFEPEEEEEEKKGVNWRI